MTRITSSSAPGYHSGNGHTITTNPVENVPSSRGDSKGVRHAKNSPLRNGFDGDDPARAGDGDEDAVTEIFSRRCVAANMQQLVLFRTSS